MFSVSLSQELPLYCFSTERIITLRFLFVFLAYEIDLRISCCLIFSLWARLSPVLILLALFCIVWACVDSSSLVWVNDGYFKSCGTSFCDICDDFLEVTIDFFFSLSLSSSLKLCHSRLSFDSFFYLNSSYL